VNVAKQDQIEAACRDIAAYCRMQTDALIAAGFTRREAVLIVAAMAGRHATR